MQHPEALEVRRVPLSEDLSKPGDYVFIENRGHRVIVKRVPIVDRLRIIRMRGTVVNL